MAPSEPYSSRELGKGDGVACPRAVFVYSPYLPLLVSPSRRPPDPLFILLLDSSWRCQAIQSSDHSRAAALGAGWHYGALVGRKEYLSCQARQLPAFK